MALGRGGDQVVIKNGNNITYIGGKAQQMEKSTRVKARVKAQALKEFMSTKDRVVVMGHKITDVDALGAGIGIYRAGKTLGKPVHIVINAFPCMKTVESFTEEKDRNIFSRAKHAA